MAVADQGFPGDALPFLSLHPFLPPVEVLERLVSWRWRLGLGLESWTPWDLLNATTQGRRHDAKSGGHGERETLMWSRGNAPSGVQGQGPGQLGGQEDEVPLKTRAFNISKG